MKNVLFVIAVVLGCSASASDKRVEKVSLRIERRMPGHGLEQVILILGPDKSEWALNSNFLNSVKGKADQKILLGHFSKKNDLSLNAMYQQFLLESIRRSKAEQVMEAHQFPKIPDNRHPHAAHIFVNQFEVAPGEIAYKDIEMILHSYSPHEVEKNWTPLHAIEVNVKPRANGSHIFSTRALPAAKDAQVAKVQNISCSDYNRVDYCKIPLYGVVAVER